jgi:hypothetical protein
LTTWPSFYPRFTASQPRIRALIAQDTGGSEVILRGIDTTRTEEGTETRLTAHLLVGGNTRS